MDALRAGDMVLSVEESLVRSVAFRLLLMNDALPLLLTSDILLTRHNVPAQERRGEGELPKAGDKRRKTLEVDSLPLGTKRLRVGRCY